MTTFSSDSLLFNSTVGLSGTSTIVPSSIENECSDGSGATDSSTLQNRIVTQAITGILMFGLGCSTELKEMWKHMKLAKQFATALFLQLIIMPFLGLGLSQAFRMTQAEAVGVIIQAVCPGGIYSNIISYYLDGNINLSIVMTTVSTIFALGTMPLWLFVFPLIINIENSCLRVPFDALGIALLVILVPMGLGLILKHFIPKKSEIVTKICTAFGSFGILLYSIIVVLTQDNSFLSDGFSWKSILVALLQLIIAFFLGYLATRIPGLSFSVSARRTVAIETALQNGALATTIVFISFSSSYSDFGSIILFSLVYSGIQLFGGFLAVSTYLLLKWRGKCKSLIPENEEEDRQTHDLSATELSADCQSNQPDEKSEHFAYANVAYEIDHHDFSS